MLCRDALQQNEEMLRSASYKDYIKLIDIITEIENILPDEYRITKEALIDFKEGYKYMVEQNKLPRLDCFKKWWGRGQQYSSYVRKK